MSGFKVGDKVMVFGDRIGTVKFGPVPSTFGASTMYAVEREGDGVRMFKGGDLETPKPTFAVGDKVTAGVVEYTLHAGPFNGISDEFWVLENNNGKHLWARADGLTKVEAPALVPVGTRVRVDRATYGERTHGMVGTVTSNTASFRGLEGDPHPYYVELGGVEGGSVYAAEVTPVDDKPADGFEYEGIFYEYGALYRDREGDLFRFRSMLSGDGTPQGQAAYGAEDGAGGGWRWSLAEVLRDYAPLTKQY